MSHGNFMATIAITIPVELITQFDLYCKNKKLFKSRVISELIREFLEKNKKLA